LPPSGADSGSSPEALDPESHAVIMKTNKLSRQARDMRAANVSALTCGRNANGGDDTADTPTRAAGAKRIRREGHHDANAPVRFSGVLASSP
jgi:hypothetical protein